MQTLPFTKSHYLNLRPTMDIQSNGFVIRSSSVDGNASKDSSVKRVKRVPNDQLCPRSPPGDSVFSLLSVKDARFVSLLITLTASDKMAIFEPLDVRIRRSTLRFTEQSYILGSVHRCLCREVYNLWRFFI